VTPLGVLLSAAGAVGLAYTLGTHLVASAGIGTIHRGSAGRRAVALTFDDGPDPIYTPRILETLARYQARATFFLVGERAQRHPEIVQAIEAAHHEVGNHTYTHSHLWVLPPAKTRHELTRCAEVLTAITGRPPRYFRPPWGKFNFVAYRHAARLGEARVLWSLRAEGWRPAAAPNAIVRTVERRLHPGAVIDLHDGGGVSGTPARTAQALPELLDLLRARGYRCVPLSELVAAVPESPAPRGVRAKFWDWYEHTWTSWFREEPLNDNGALAMSVTPYRGPAVLLRDGTQVQSGDLIGEIHFRRDHFMRLHREVRPGELGLVLRRDLTQSLEALARLAVEDPGYRRLEAFHGVTLFWREARMLGLEPRPITNPWPRWALGWYQRMLLARDHPLGRRRLAITFRDAGNVWLSRTTLLKRYGSRLTVRSD
jgi:peptidoglycan/xylan/chitin deacetylase (PgdA/CDA1 family)